MRFFQDREVSLKSENDFGDAFFDAGMAFFCLGKWCCVWYDVQNSRQGIQERSNYGSIFICVFMGGDDHCSVYFADLQR